MIKFLDQFHFFQYLMKRMQHKMLLILFSSLLSIFLINDFMHLVEEEKTTPLTIIFNNSVSTKKEMENNWMLKIEESWLSKKLFSV